MYHLEPQFNTNKEPKNDVSDEIAAALEIRALLNEMHKNDIDLLVFGNGWRTVKRKFNYSWQCMDEITIVFETDLLLCLRKSHDKDWKP